MRLAPAAVALFSALSVWTGALTAQASGLTLDEFLARIRANSSRIAAARLVEEAARDGEREAAVRFSSLPEIEIAVGRRGGRQGFNHFEFGIQQVFEAPASRAGRASVASRELSHRIADAEVVTRDVLREAAGVFLRAAHAAERARQVTAAEDTARAAYNHLMKLPISGMNGSDTGSADLRAARDHLGRTEARRLLMAAAEAAAMGELALLLGARAPLTVGHAFTPSALSEMDDLLQPANDRGAINRLEADIRAAEADADASRRSRRPDIGVAVRYEREEGANVLLGGISFALPFLAREASTPPPVSARLTQLRQILDTERQRLRIEIESASTVWRLRVQAASLLHRVVERMDADERVAVRRFESGAISLDELLTASLGALETRSLHLDAALEAELARVALRSIAGMLK